MPLVRQIVYYNGQGYERLSRSPNTVTPLLRDHYSLPFDDNEKIFLLAQMFTKEQHYV